MVSKLTGFVYYASCACGKTNVIRDNIARTWYKYQCKRCKGYLTVWKDSVVVYDFSDMRTRREWRLKDNAGSCTTVYSGKKIPLLYYPGYCYAPVDHGDLKGDPFMGATKN